MRKFILVIPVVVVLAVIAAYAYSHLHYGRNTLPPQYYHHSTSLPSSKSFSHVVIILEENKPKGTVIGNSSAPYINKLATTYSQATNYYAITNPSLPNYIALTSGTTAGITNDCNPPSNSCMANVSNIADRLEHAGKTWKEYAESMPQPCYPYTSGEYAVKHDPFMYYPDITDNNSRCKSHVVPFSQLATDLSTVNSLPNYIFITPNLCDDMHDCSVAAGDSWLSKQVPSILNSPAFKKENSLLVIVWDEGDNSNNNVPVIFAGPAAKHGYIRNTYYSHYSLLHTIENNWNLPPLTQNDKSAPLMTDMLQ